MPSRLFSLLDEVERVFRQAAAFDAARSWTVTRSVSEAHGMGRITLMPVRADSSLIRGSVFLELLAPGGDHPSVKVSFNWHGSDAFPSTILDSSPFANWRAEATRMASIWLAGPLAATVTDGDFMPHIALAS